MSRVIDVRLAARWADAVAAFCRLATSLAQRGWDFDRLHDALADAEVAFESIAGAVNAGRIDDLEKLITRAEIEIEGAIRALGDEVGIHMFTEEQRCRRHDAG